MSLDEGLSFHGGIKLETKVAPSGSLQLPALQVVAWGSLGMWTLLLHVSLGCDMVHPSLTALPHT